MGGASCYIRLGVDEMLDYKTTANKSNNVDFPFTAPINASGPTAIDGTEFIAELLTQTWGSQQALLASIGKNPSGNADQADASETLDAIIEQAMGRAQAVLEGGGSAADAYVVEAQATLTPQGTSTGKNGVAHSYFEGMVLTFDIAAPNTGTSTLNAFGLGVQFIKMPNGSNVIAGDLSGRITLGYDGTNFVVLASAGDSVFNSVRTGAIVEEVAGAGTDINGLRARDGRAMFDTRLYSNLQIQNNIANPLFKVDVDAEFISVEGWKWEPGSAQIVDLTVSGVGGLDTGSEANSTWYHIWAIANVQNPAVPVFGLLFSLQFTDSGSDPTMPAGYTKKVYLSAARNDSGGDLVDFVQRDNKVPIPALFIIASASPVADDTYESINIAVEVPPTAKKIAGDFRTFNVSVSTQLTVASTLAGLGETRLGSGGTVTSANQRIGYWALNVVSYPLVYFKGVTTDVNSLTISSYEF